MQVKLPGGCTPFISHGCANRQVRGSNSEPGVGEAVTGSDNCVPRNRLCDAEHNTVSREESDREKDKRKSDRERDKEKKREREG